MREGERERKRGRGDIMIGSNITPLSYVTKDN